MGQGIGKGNDAGRRVRECSTEGINLAKLPSNLLRLCEALQEVVLGVAFEFLDKKRRDVTDWGIPFSKREYTSLPVKEIRSVPST